MLVWNLQTKKPEFKIRFRQQILKMAIRPKLVIFALANRVSVFERATLTHLVKVPIKLAEGFLTRKARNHQKRGSHPISVGLGRRSPSASSLAQEQFLFTFSETRPVFGPQIRTRGPAQANFSQASSISFVLKSRISPQKSVFPRGTTIKRSSAFWQKSRSRHGRHRRRHRHGPRKRAFWTNFVCFL